MNRKFFVSILIVLEIRVHTHLTIRNHTDYNLCAARTNGVACCRFTSEFEVHLPTEYCTFINYVVCYDATMP